MENLLAALRYIVHLLEANREFVQGISFAIFGGFVRVYLRDKGKLEFRIIFAGILGASFIGVILIKLAAYYAVDKKLVIVGTSLAGFCYVEVIEIFTSRFLNFLKQEKYKRGG